MANRFNNNRSLLPFFLTCLLLAPTMVIAKQTANSYQDFKLSLKKASGNINEEIGTELKNKQYKGYSEEKEQGVSGSKGAWNAQLSAYLKVSKKVHPDELISQSAPLTLVNYDDRAEYTLILPAINQLFAGNVIKNLGEKKRLLAERNKDVAVDYLEENNQITLTATYLYPEDATAEKTQRRLENLFRDSIDLLKQQMELSISEKAALLKLLEKSKPVHLTKDELILLMDKLDLNLADSETEVSRATEGKFRFTQDSNTYYIWNSGSQIDIGLAINTKPNSESSLFDKDSKLSKWLNENPAKNAGNMKIKQLGAPTPDGSREIAIIAIFELDGNTRGKDLVDALEKFIEDYSEKVTKELINAKII